ncbi:hypothetical protein [Cyclobacterium roseum]|uniref:hypothetical protein n=1 Tax=Cyclobacterium roseum TaxID=2666137 RepID=UPI001390A931|nr:hypothetical protein [Cyclobacterium roseum]
MANRSKLPIYYIDEEKDMEMLVEQAVNSTLDENITRYFQVLAFNYSLAGIDIYDHSMEKTIYYIADESK